jgi:hypothetical protein
MEITVVVVGRGGGTSDALRRAFQRLADTEWTRVRVQRAIAEQVAASGLQAPADASPAWARTVETVALDRLIADNPGGRVLVLCEPECARELAAQVLEVRAAAVPIPESGSITRFRASRTGVRSLVCMNDTLHLTAAAAGAPS